VQDESLVHGHDDDSGTVGRARRGDPEMDLPRVVEPPDRA
jgi:hypothetical protein